MILLVLLKNQQYKKYDLKYLGIQVLTEQLHFNAYIHFEPKN